MVFWAETTQEHTHICVHVCLYMHASAPFSMVNGTIGVVRSQHLLVLSFDGCASFFLLLYIYYISAEDSNAKIIVRVNEQTCCVFDSLFSWHTFP